MCVTYRPIFPVSILTNFQHVLVHVRDYRMGIYGQLSLKESIGDDQVGAN